MTADAARLPQGVWPVGDRPPDFQWPSSLPVVRHVAGAQAQALTTPLDAAFFRRTRKAYMVEAIKESASESYRTVAKGLPKFGKAEAIEAAVDAMSGRRWPEQPMEEAA